MRTVVFFCFAACLCAGGEAESQPPTRAQALVRRWTVVDMWEADDLPDPHVLEAQHWIATAADSLLVLDPVDARIRLFRPRSAPKDLFGGRGTGPGQLQGAVGMGSATWGVWLVDPILRRASIFRRGQLDRTVDLRDLHKSCGVFGPIGFAAESVLVGAPMTGPSEGRPPPLPVLAFRPHAGVCDTIHQGLSPGRPFLLTSRGGAVAYQPFDDGSFINVDPLGGVWFVVRQTDKVPAGSVRIGHYDLRLRKWRERLISVPKVRVSQAQRDSVRRVANALLDSARLSGREREQVLKSQLRLPEWWPTVVSSHTSADGSLWMALPPDGRPLTTYIVLPGATSEPFRIEIARGTRVVASALPYFWTVSISNGEPRDLSRLRISDLATFKP